MEILCSLAWSFTKIEFVLAFRIHIINFDLTLVMPNSFHKADWRWQAKLHWLADVLVFKFSMSMELSLMKRLINPDCPLMARMIYARVYEMSDLSIGHWNIGFDFHKFWRFLNRCKFPNFEKRIFCYYTCNKCFKPLKSQIRPWV